MKTCQLFHSRQLTRVHNDPANMQILLDKVLGFPRQWHFTGKSPNWFAPDDYCELQISFNLVLHFLAISFTIHLYIKHLHYRFYFSDLVLDADMKPFLKIFRNLTEVREWTRWIIFCIFITKCCYLLLMITSFWYWRASPSHRNHTKLRRNKYSRNK